MPLFNRDQLARIEGYLANDQTSEVLPALQGLVADLEAYIDENCVATDEDQFFSFSTPFQKLTYRRVEADPRRLHDVPVPFDRAYSDFAFCLIGQHDYEKAAEALKQAVRWNPMNCSYRLDLATLLKQLGEYEQYLKMTYSVFARAASSAHLVRAYLNFADYFMQCGQFETAAACVKSALRLAPEDKRSTTVASKLTVEHGCNPLEMTDEDAARLLDEQGIPEGANVEVVLSALLLADISAAQGDLSTCQDMAQVAVDLVGQKRAMVLAELVREHGEENFPDDIDGGLSSSNEYASPAAQATLDGAARAASQSTGQE